MGSRTRWSASVHLTWLIALLLNQITPGASFAEERHALLIGNGAYRTIGRLDNPDNDMRLMAATLGSLGFDVLEAEDLDRASMMRAIKQFGHRLQDAGEDTVGLFYYAGHGIQVDGSNYLLPVDAEVARITDVDIEAVNLRSILGQMEGAANRLNFVILDACRNNPISRGMRSVDRGLAQVDAPHGTLIAYSTAPGSVAIDGTDEHSPYTEALARALRKPGVVAEEVFRNVRVDVMAATNAEQVPWEASSLTGAFYFNPADGVAEARPGPSAAVTDEAVGDPGYQLMPAEGLFVVRDVGELRFEPSEEARSLARLEPGDEVEAIDRTRDLAWYRIRTARDLKGFVPEELLSMAEPSLRVAHADPQQDPNGLDETSQASLNGRWRGKYQCQQDFIGMSLEIADGGQGRLSAVFAFFPLPGQPSFPRGSFEMAGAFDDARRTLRLQAERWIERPLGYQKHDLEGQWDGTTITGRILTTGCGHIALLRE